VGRRIWKGLYAGAGFIYIYSGNTNVLIEGANGQVFFANAYRNTVGGGVFLQYNIWKGFYTRVRVDLLHRSIDDLDNAEVLVNTSSGKQYLYMPKIRINIPDLPLTIGYNLLINRKLFFPLSLSYNILYTFSNKNLSVYPAGAIIKIGLFKLF
jgi:hypothetical protein